ncbi:hypothetical protein SARC_00756 [Sphaeroforma arctica JP610]|uniref:Uncharacterized protein n=1 Tax=Sphaeroforma arctica JP610 TaxID=667725 RepID=A0A0L0GFS7_9EUKA|nr:hypothetical protein SARC_00756 [Sphaeroforma arctica JP610]KNC87133.1 hypothetical protein SARC_00756 [Sphaeroforma arctica JP610]|eukprot:XP_014161035.1 hypothetical protein SARC_00756 [Sphaeroforma arctica JP610]
MCCRKVKSCARNEKLLNITGVSTPEFVTTNIGDDTNKGHMTIPGRNSNGNAVGDNDHDGVLTTPEESVRNNYMMLKAEQSWLQNGHEPSVESGRARRRDSVYIAIEGFRQLQRRNHN